MTRILLMALFVLALTTGEAQAQTNTASTAGIAQVDQSYNTLVFDYNNDGIQDFLYSPQNDKAGRQLWQGNGDGTFTLVNHLVSALTTDQHSCTSADFDHNGLPDVYCAMGTVHASRTKANPLWLQTAPNSWQLNEASGAQDPYGRGYSTSTGDFNGDGWPDLFVDNFHPRPDGNPTPNRVFLNLGDDAQGNWLGFADDHDAVAEQEVGNRGCDFTTDFNHDGNTDVVFCGTQRMWLLAGDGTGHFTDTSAAMGLANFFTADAALADINGDGLKDLVFAKLGQWGVRLGKATGGFAAATGTHPETAGRMVSVADADGNGTPDVYVLQGNGQPGCTNCPTNYPDQLWLNNGKGVFTSTVVPSASGSGDTVNAINSGGNNLFIVGNGANLIAGPLQLIGYTPGG